MVDGDLPDLPLPRRSKMNFKHVAGLNSLKEVLRTEVIYLYLTGSLQSFIIRP